MVEIPDGADWVIETDADGVEQDEQYPQSPVLAANP